MIFRTPRLWENCVERKSSSMGFLNISLSSRKLKLSWVLTFWTDFFSYGESSSPKFGETRTSHTTLQVRPDYEEVESAHGKADWCCNLKPQLKKAGYCDSSCLKVQYSPYYRRAPFRVWIFTVYNNKHAGNFFKNHFTYRNYLLYITMSLSPFPCPFRLYPSYLNVKP